MSSVDKRVVDMQFNNKQFEDGIQSSLKSLNNLKKGLEDAGDGSAFSGLKASIDTIGERFSAFSIVGITALQNITNAAIDAGVAIVKSLTIEPVMSGFTKYEDKTKSVQMIMNSTGKSVDEVNSSLEKLNWFTDETSYSFTDMVSNIGKFTAQKVPLEQAITAMEGIANAAALAGQGSGEASRAMYNFAQALGVGSVKLMDWKSIENANMATAEFKQTIIDSAVSLGTLKKKADGTFTTLKGNTVTVENFSSTLSEAWFSKDVLMDSLGKYGAYADEVFQIATEKGLSCAEAMKLVEGKSRRCFLNEI